MTDQLMEILILIAEWMGSLLIGCWIVDWLERRGMK